MGEYMLRVRVPLLAQRGRHCGHDVLRAVGVAERSEKREGWKCAVTRSPGVPRSRSRGGCAASTQVVGAAGCGTARPGASNVACHGNNWR